MTNRTFRKALPLRPTSIYRVVRFSPPDFRSTLCHRNHQPMILLKLRTFTRPTIQRTCIATSAIRMQSTNENKRGQGVSHASGESHVPGKVQEAAPQGLEEALPDKVRAARGFQMTHSVRISNRIMKLHPTGPEPGQSTNKTHAKDEGNASFVPKKLQEKLPESVERAVPNIIHDTGKK